MTVKHPFWYWLLGFLGIITFFMVFWGIPNTSLLPLITILLAIGLIALLTVVILKMSGNGASWTGMHQWALVTGALTFFILLAPLQEFAPGRTDNTAGMTIVGLAAAAFLLWLWWRLRRNLTSKSTKQEVKR